MRGICDTLAACGRPVSEEDQVLSILAGLGLEFEPTIGILIQGFIPIMLELPVPTSFVRKQSSSTICFT